MTATSTAAQPATARARPGAPWAWPAAYGMYVAGLAWLFLRRNADYGIDDSFISYRYAQNFADSYGLVFNPGEHFYGTTAAGYAAFLGLLHAVTTLPIPRMSIVVATVSLAALAACLPTLARRVPGARRWILSGVFATAAFVLTPLNVAAGHETVPYLSLALVGTLCVTHWSRPLLAAVLVAAATTFRPDVALLAVLLVPALWLVARMPVRVFLRSSALWRYLGGYAAVMLLWLVFLLGEFGTVIPGTLDAKRAQVGLGYWPIYGPEQLWGYLRDWVGVPLVALALVGVVAVGLRPSRRDAAVAAVWSAFALGVAAFYTATSVTFWQWYGAPFYVALLVVAFIGWSNLSALRRGWVAVALLAAVMVWHIPSIRSWQQTPNVNPHIRAYSEVAAYLADAAPDGASILMPEPGSFGYGLGPRYTVIDELGLVSPGVAQALLRDDTGWAFRTYRPDYVICSWHGRYTTCDQGLQKQGYALVGEFDRGFWEPYVGRGARLFIREDLAAGGTARQRP